MIERMRRRALVSAIEYCAELGSHRRLREKSPCPWLSLRPGRRASYEDGVKKFGKDLSEALQLRYPQAFEAVESSVWECLSSDRSEHWLRLRLHTYFHQGVTEAETSDLVARLSVEGEMLQTAHELESVAILVCALRLAIPYRKQEIAQRIAMKIARQLLLLAGSPLHVGAAGEIWVYCDRFVEGLSKENLRLRFAENTWTWFAQHALAVRARCLEMAFRYPLASELDPKVMPILLKELATGVANLDPEEIVRVLGGFSCMNPHRRAIPDAEHIGIWRASVG